MRAATAAAGPPPGAEPAAPEGRGRGRTGPRHVPETDEEEDASTPDDGSGHQADS